MTRQLIRRATLIALAPLLLAAQSRPGWLGVFLSDAVDGGVEVVGVVSGGPADASGIAVGDVLIELAGQSVVGRERVAELLDQRREGETVRLVVVRNGTPIDRVIRLAGREPWPAPQPRVPAPPPSPIARSAIAAGATGAAGPGESLKWGIEVADIGAELRRHYGAPAERGILVTRVEKGGPAALAGFATGDVWVELDGRSVGLRADIDRTLPDPRAARGVATVVRSRKLVTLDLAAGSARSGATACEEREHQLNLEIERLRIRVDELERQSPHPPGFDNSVNNSSIEPSTRSPVFLSSSTGEDPPGTSATAVPARAAVSTSRTMSPM